MKTYILRPQPHPARANCIQAIREAPDGMVVQIKEQTRSLEANAAMWARLNEIAAKVEWYGKKLAPEDWKNVFSASVRKLDVVPNLDGTGFVALGQSTSKMTKAQMSDMLELMNAFCAERGIE